MNEYVRAGHGPVLRDGVRRSSATSPSSSSPAPPRGSSWAIVINGFLGGGLTVKAWVWICVGFLVLLNLAGIRPFAVLEVFLTFPVAISLLDHRHRRPRRRRLGRADRRRSRTSRSPGACSRRCSGSRSSPSSASSTPARSPRSSGDRTRDIPWGIFIGLDAGLDPARALRARGDSLHPGRLLGDPTQITSMNIGIAIFGEAGKWWMGLMMIGASLGTLNAVLAGRAPDPLRHGADAAAAAAVRLPAALDACPGRRDRDAMALIVVLMNLFDATTSATFIQLILAGVLGWATAYFLINVSLVMPADPRAGRDAGRTARRSSRSRRSSATGLLALAAYKIFPDPGSSASSIYYRYFGIFLGSRRRVLARLQPLRLPQPGRRSSGPSRSRGLPRDRVISDGHRRSRSSRAGRTCTATTR